MRLMSAFLIVLVALLLGMPTAGAVTDGLAYREDTVFTVLENSVRVDTTAVMGNTTSERRQGTTIYYTYFDRMVLIIPAEAEELSVTSGGRQLTTTSEGYDADFDLITARLPSQLRSGQSRTIKIGYTLPRGEIRGDGIFFSNPAFHGFPIWSLSDPGTGSLKLRVPEDAEMGEFGESLRRLGTEDGFVIWEPQDFAEPEDFYTYVTVTLDDQLTREEFSVSGQDIVLRTWPGDEVWATFARDTIEEGLPALEELIGLPVPDQSSLEVTESVTPYFYGYGGWYNPQETSIEVGNKLDDAVMLHELSHAWFNDGLFVERWVAEGLAEEFTWQAQRSLDWETEALPTKPESNGPGVADLVDWGSGSTARLGEDDLRSTEEFGYNASWYAIHELVEIIGIEGMQQVIGAADTNSISYVGAGSAEPTNKSDDWRRLLDLISDAGMDSDQEAIESVFVNYVIHPSSMNDLDERRVARAAYRDFTNSELAWTVPLEIRESLTSWRFDQARDVMNEAQGVQDRYSAVALTASDVGLTISGAARDAYERRESDFDSALYVLGAQADAIPTIERLRNTRDRELTTNQRWGIGDVDLGPLVAQAENAFAMDDYNQIEVAQAHLDRTLAAAELVGANRIRWTKIGIGAGAVSTVLLVSMLVRRLRRRGRTGLDQAITQEDVILSA